MIKKILNFSFLSLFAIFLFLFILYSFILIHNEKIIYEQTHFDKDKFYLNFYSQLKNNLDSKDLVGVNYWGELFVFSENLIFKKRINFNKGFVYKITRMVLDKNNFLWFFFDGISKNSDSRMSSDKILLFENNNFDKKFINFTKITNPFDVCFLDNKAFVVSWETGQEFGVAKINLTNYRVEKEKVFKNFKNKSTGLVYEILCLNDSIIIASDNLYLFDKSNFNLEELFLTKQNTITLTYNNDKNLVYFNFYNESLGKSYIFSFSLENKSFSKKEFKSKVSKLSYNNQNKRLYVVLNNDHSFILSLNSTLEDRKKLYLPNYYDIIKFENYLISGTSYFNIYNNQTRYFQNFSQITWQSFIKLN